jgi:hypothetical protein
MRTSVGSDPKWPWVAGNTKMTMGRSNKRVLRGGPNPISQLKFWQNPSPSIEIPVDKKPFIYR